VTVSTHTYTAELVGYVVPITLLGGRIGLDASRWPHVQATIEIPAPATLLDLIDPRHPNRIRIHAAATFPTFSQSRTFDLGIRRVQPARATGRATVTLASDEAILQDYAPLADDTGAWSYASSLRGIVNYVLGKIGAVLQPGTEDADMTPYWAVTNLMPNPAARNIVGNWIAGGANGSLIRETGWPAGSIPAGNDITTTYFSSWTGNSGLGQGGAVAQTASAVPYAPCKPNTVYTISTWVHIQALTKTLRLMCQVFGSDGAVLDGGKVLLTQPVAASTWTRLVATIKTPPNAARLGPFVYPDTSQQWASGNVLRTTAWMIHEGEYPIPVPFHDGSGPDPVHYTYEASGAPNASAATRIPRPGMERSPDALTWKAGVSAMDFLAPLLQSAGLRLVCDEQRRWTLRNDAFTTPGSIALRWGVNIISAGEEISRESDDWFDGQVTTYRWKDRDGTEQTRQDAYALPGATKIRRLDIDAPYPGPGRSQYAVKRAQGKGRTLDIGSVADWAAACEQLLTVTLDGSGVQAGKAERIEFDLSTDRMTVHSRTIDIPAGAIDLLDGTIDALPGTIDSL
jgi:hypothetical protein